jgi:endonuclease/exonuclease/phosphatase (EEP) superfamily protein YafD
MSQKEHTKNTMRTYGTLMKLSLLFLPMLKLGKPTPMAWQAVLKLGKLMPLALQAHVFGEAGENKLLRS